MSVFEKKSCSTFQDQKEPSSNSQPLKLKVRQLESALLILQQLLLVDKVIQVKPIKNIRYDSDESDDE